MQRLVSAAWEMEGPRVGVHVGDLEWWIVLERQQSSVISLWYARDQLVAWAWVSPPAELDQHIQAQHRNGPLYEEILDWFEAVTASKPNPPHESTAFQFEPTATHIWLLEGRGYRRADRGYVHHARSLTEPLPDPSIPDGFGLRHVRGPDDIERRVAVHRSAFAPSRMTAERYQKVLASRHYRSELDWVAVAPTGEFASFCNIWLDPGNAVALLEPVGTADGFRKMGLGRAVCLAALAAAAGEGARTAVVLSADDNPGSLALYRSLGFEEYGRTDRFTKRLSVEGSRP